MSMGGNVGDAWIEIGAEDDTDDDVKRIEKKLVASLKAAAEKAGQEFARELGKSADEAGNEMVRHLRDDIKIIDQELDDLAEDRSLNIEANAVTKAAAAQLAYAARDRFVNFWVRLRGNIARDLNRVVRGLSGLNLITAWRDALVNMAASFPQLILRTSMWAGVLTLLLVPLLNLLTIMAPLGRSLQSILGILLAAPAAIGAVAAYIGVLVAAFKDLESAVGPAGKRANEFVNGLKQEFSALQDVIQENFWEGFIGPAEELMSTLLPQLQSGLSSLASMIGNQWGAIADAIRQQLGDSGLDAFFQNLSKGIENATPGLASFAAAFTRIAEQGATLFPKFGDWLTKIGTSFNEWAKTADIAGMIEEAATQMGHLWNVAKQLGGIIAGIFRAMDTGKSTGLESMAATLQRVHEIIDSEPFQRALGTIFQGVSAAATTLREALGPIGDSLAKLAPVISNLFSVLAGGVADALTGILAALSTPVAKEGLNSAIEALAGVLSGIDWSALSGIVGAFGGLISAVMPLVVGLVNTLLPLITPLADAAAGLVGIFTGAAGATEQFANSLATFLVGAVNTVAELLPTLIPIILNVMTALVGAILQAMPQIVATLSELLPTLIQQIVEAVPVLLDLIINALMQLIPLLIGMLPMLVQAGITLLLGLVDAAITAMPQIIAALQLLIVELVMALGQMAPQLLAMGIMLFLELVKAVLTIVPALIDALVSLLPIIIEQIVNMLPELLDAGIELFMMLIEAVAEIIPDLIVALIALLPKIVATLISLIPRLLMAGVELFIALVKAIPKIIPQLLDELAKLGPKIVNEILSIGPKLLDAGAQLIGKLIEGVKSMFGAVGEAFGGVMDFIGGFFPHSPAKWGPFALQGWRQLAKSGQAIANQFAQGFQNSMPSIEASVASMMSPYLEAMSSLDRLVVRTAAASQNVVNNTTTIDRRSDIRVEGSGDPRAVAYEVMDLIAEDSEV